MTPSWPTPGRRRRFAGLRNMLRYPSFRMWRFPAVRRDVTIRVVSLLTLLVLLVVFWWTVISWTVSAMSEASPTPGTLRVKVRADCVSDELRFVVKSTIPTELRTEAEVVSNVLYVTKHNGRHKTRTLFHPESAGSWSVPNSTREVVTIRYPNGLPAEAVLQVEWHLAHKNIDRTVEAWFEYETHCAPVERRDITCTPPDTSTCLLPPGVES